MSDNPPAPKRGFLSRKVFGVPAVYLAGGFVAILAVLAWRMKPSAQDSTTPDAASAASDGADLAASGPVLADGTVYPTMPSGSVTGTPAPAETDPELANQSIPTNDAWLVKGVAFLIQKGYGPGDAQAALQLYLDGSALSYDQGVMRDLVIKEYGIPPTPPQIGSTAAQPARTQGPVPRLHVVKNANEDSLAELAMLYYGRNDAFAISAIQKATENAGLGGRTSGFEVGTAIYIPLLPSPATTGGTPTPVVTNPPPTHTAPKPGVHLTGPVWPGKVYALGSRGSAVKWIQQRLNARIHAGLVPDGIYGPKTRAAVLRYQKLHRDLADDGKVGKATWNSLRVVG